MTIIKPLPVTHWKIKNSLNKDIENLLSNEFGIHPIISQILANREFMDISSTRRYLYPSLNDLYNPFLMKDMKAGITRLLKAIHNHEKIVIYGDYDAEWNNFRSHSF